MRDNTEGTSLSLSEVLWQLRFYAWAAVVFTIICFVTPIGAAVCGPPTGGNPGCSGAGNPVHLATGNKFQQETDLAPLPGTLGLEFSRYYNSRLNDFGTVGRGWRHSYDVALSDLGDSLQILTADGRRIIFPRNLAQPALCASQNPDDGQVTIETLPSGKKRYQWQQPDGLQYGFDHEGQLAQISAPNGEQTLLGRTPRGELLTVTDPQGRVLRFSYAAIKGLGAHRGIVAVDTPLGRIMFMHTPGGKRGAGNLIEVIRTDGSARRYRYSADDAASADPHLLTAVLAVAPIADGKTAPEQRLRSYAYGEYGRVVRSEAHALDSNHPSHVLTFDYGEQATIITHGSAQATRIRFALVADDWRVIEVTGAGCTQCPEPGWRYRWNNRGQLEEAVRFDAGNSVIERTRYQRDSAGRILKAERFAGSAGTPLAWVRYRYEGSSALPIEIARASVVAGKEHVLAIAYNSQRQPVRVSESGWQPAAGASSLQALFRTTELSYRSIAGASRVIAIDGPLEGALDTTTYHYDDRGRLAAVRFPASLTQRFGYDEHGRLIDRINTDGAPERFSYDAAGAIKMSARAGSATWMWRDVEGRVAQLFDPIGQRMFIGYDSVGRVASLNDAQRNRIALEFDRHGRVVAQTLSNPDGSIAGARHASADQRADVVAAGSERASDIGATLAGADNAARPAPAFDVTAVVARFSDLDRSTQRTAVYDAQGRPTAYVHDDFGRLIAEVSPVSGTTRYDYDAADRLIRKTASDGGAVAYERDAAGRVVRLQTEGEDARIEWGGANKPRRIRYREGEESFEYDTAARLIAHIRHIDGKSFTTRYEYDANGRMRNKRLPDGLTIDYRYRGSVYPKPGVLESVWLQGAIDTPILTELNRAEETYNARGFVFGNGLAFGRELDQAGRVLSAGNAQVGRTQLTYGADEEVTGVKLQTNVGVGARARADVAPAWITRARGEWQTSQLFGAIGTNALGVGKHPQADEALPAWLQSSSNSASAIARHFDTRGRLIEQGDRRYVWDGLNRLVEVSEASEQLVARYRYNVFGERIAKIVFDSQGHGKTTYYFYDGSTLEAEADESGQVTRQYVHLDNRPIALLEGNKVYAIHTDHRLAPLAMTDAGRRVVWQAQLGNNGATRVDEASQMRLDLRGSNQWFDAETGLHYNTHRYLDPQRGRYLTPDPLGLAVGRDLYQFALGQPHRYVDLIGLAPQDPFKTPIGTPRTATFAEKLQYVFEVAGDRLGGDVGQALKDLVSPDALVTTAALFAAWGAAQFTPFGWAADLLIAGVGYAFLGKAIVDVVVTTIATFNQINRATCVNDLNKAGETLSRGMAAAAIELGAGGAFKIASHLRTSFGRSGAKPPSAPPRVLVRLEDVADTYGNRTPSYLAPTQFTWRAPATGGIAARGTALEQAAVAYARGYHGATHVWQPQWQQGAALRGLDIAYLRPDGKLVIGEAKAHSGNINDLTAFGSTRLETLELNLAKLRELVEQDRSLSVEMRRNVLRQIDNRTFETELFLAPKGNVPDPKLDVLQDRLGRPLDRVIVLPEGPPLGA